mmetsp:Transcript_6572/g.10028  ORF Transcript_6572/g.10028 Transcript_6572/m.10028 type:complete len:83 (+) Transcript_6572:631-879(+)
MSTPKGLSKGPGTGSISIDKSVADVVTGSSGTVGGRVGRGLSTGATVGSVGAGPPGATVIGALVGGETGAIVGAAVVSEGMV